MKVPFWAENPDFLINSATFWPRSETSAEDNLNRITRFIILSSIIIGAIMKSTRPLYLGLFAITAVAILYFLSFRQRMDTFGNYNNGPNLYGPNGSFGTGYNMPQLYNIPQEGLLYKPNNPTGVPPVNSNGLPSPYQYPMYNYGNGPQESRIANDIQNAKNSSSSPRLRSPTDNNPLMNVMPLDYDAKPFFDGHEKINYPTPQAQQTRDEIETSFEKGLFQNSSGKLWNRTNSQRQYVSQPVSTVPNKQGQFASWLYGTRQNCKQGSIYNSYGVEYTDDSLMCNGFNVATPTNQGLLNGDLMSSVQQ
jgi:hypothetical protein